MRLETETWNRNLELKLGIESWNWNLKLKLEIEASNWNLRLKLEIGTWNWNLILKLETQNWHLKLKLEIKTWNWNLKLKLDIETWNWILCTHTQSLSCDPRRSCSMIFQRCRVHHYHVFWQPFPGLWCLMNWWVLMFLLVPFSQQNSQHYFCRALVWW